MIGRVLLDNDTFIIRLGLFGGVRVALKRRGLTRKVTNAEKAWLLEAIETLRQSGVAIEPGSGPVEQMLSDFADAVFGGRAAWSAFFMTPPEDAAGDYLRR